MKFLFPILLFSAGLCGQDHLNTSLISNLDYSESVNDVWGYTALDNTEYAIVGTRNGISVVSLENPAEPVEISNIPGTRSVWRDIKTHKEYAYAVADQGSDGLLIMDMSALPDSVSHIFWKPQLSLGNSRPTLRTCHNLYIDDGYIYLAGCNVSNRGVMILDINADPMNPVFLGAADLTYSHDAFVRDNKLFASEINEGNLGIYDVSNKSEPVLLARQRTSSAFTHNAWSSDDNTTVYTTDERSEAFVDAYDISDLDQIKQIDKYQVLKSKGSGVVPHNTHYHNGFLVTSWYTEGVVVTDAHRPENLVRVAQYDTYTQGGGGFNGCWGAFPYLPSGNVLASDISGGLYVIDVDYKRASYLEGMVTDIESGLIVNNANVRIISEDLNEAISNASGQYKTGQATEGMFKAIATHPNYFNDTIDVELNAGMVTIGDFKLKPLTRNSITANVRDAITGQPIPDAEILIISSNETITDNADMNGSFQANVFSGETEVIVGKLGYKSAIQSFTANDSRTLNFDLEPGIYDDFNFDFGWSVKSNATTGQWIRSIPSGTLNAGVASNPDQDLPDDIGAYAYVTGNVGGSPAIDDVDDGETILISPVFDLSDMANPLLRYSLWFYNGGGAGSIPNDVLEVSLTDGINEEVVQQVRNISEDGGKWFEQSEIEIKEYLSDLKNVQVMIRVADDDPGHLVEGGFDGFSIVESTISATEEEILEAGIIINPNPFGDVLNVSSRVKIEQYRLYNLKGQLIKSEYGNLGKQLYIETNQLQTGYHFIELHLANGSVISEKIVKAEE